MSTTDTSAIDSKKNETEDDSGSPNYVGFAVGLLSHAIYVFIVFGVIGSIGLYTSKVAQTNMLPDNMDYAPFGTKSPKMEDGIVNINVIKEYGFFGMGWLFGETPKVFTTKLKFDQSDILKGYESGFIGMINSLKTDPEKASFFGLYMRDVLFNMIAMNNLYINKVYGICGEYLPETVVLLFYPMFLVLSSIFMLFANMFFSFFYQIKYWGDFFMDRSVKDGNVRWNEPFTYLRPWRSFCLFLYAIFLFFPMNGILPLITSTYTFFAPLFITAQVEHTKQTYGFMQCFQDIFLYKSQFFLIMLTYGLVTNSIQYLGMNGLIGCLVGIAIALFGFHLYKQYIPKDNPASTPGFASKKMKGGKKK